MVCADRVMHTATPRLFYRSVTLLIRFEFYIKYIVKTHRLYRHSSVQRNVASEQLYLNLSKIAQTKNLKENKG